ncbi:hypothetical protein IMG5_167660 [Ichthyophthirius multifiliis]|uniref:WD40-repeat-containing domain n=1 Tax=Ichthyophthirius multifiliis TaxID=5932 RepID=G0R0Z2_ICHMU|nr:hypothetical protein IMG5_167660 [Ichthyophthirius multifiliis]EGR28857.1 hypothetical protein IMG5_167660 [Ichthyophthirius multifiliis]|eukprot:XP_004030093.1 hypothetical protein IMG5_167660 [Ichthyophthirius multifiliis]
MKIINYQNYQNINLFKQINQDYIISVLDKNVLEKLKQKFDKKSLDIIQFVYLFLQVLDHKQEEIIYLTLALINFFQSLSESIYDNQNKINFNDLTDKISLKVNIQNEAFQIQTKAYIPLNKFRSNKSQQNNNFQDIDPQIIYEYNYSHNINRLLQGNLLSDSITHKNKQILNAIYAKEIKKVIVLDSLDDKLQLYDLNCQRVQLISLNCHRNDNPNIIIFNMAWSNKQLRIGAVLKNYSISFWDLVDNFKFEKNFFIHGLTQDNQSNIWYLENLDYWITTDYSNQIYAWDILNETTLFTVRFQYIQGNITQIVEMPYLQCIAISSTDKKITFCNLEKQQYLFMIELPTQGAQQMVFSNDFQILITSGYENNISLYNINAEHMEYTLVGKLEGHIQLISCIQVIENTPIIVSSDDQGLIKLWDIRNQKCIQSLKCTSFQSIISKKCANVNLILDIYTEGFLGVIGNRLNLIKFDKGSNNINLNNFVLNNQNKKFFNKQQQQEFQFPLKVESDFQRQEIIVCTMKEIKVYDIHNGRCKFKFKSLMENKDDEYTSFKLIQQSQFFILGNQKGQISLHDLQNKGERVKYLKGHQDEVNILKIDYANKLLISVGYDSQIIIQKIHGSKSDKKRLIQNIKNGKVFFLLLFQYMQKKGVNIIEISVYHNVFFISSINSEKVYIFDYEYGKLAGCFQFEQNQEPTAMSIVNGFQLLLVSTSDNFIYIIYFLKKENQQFEFIQLGNINIVKNLEEYYNNIYFKFQEDSEIVKKAQFYVTTSKGYLLKFNFLNIQQNYDQIKIIPHSNTRVNYNPYRENIEDFQKAQQNLVYEPTLIRTKINFLQNNNSNQFLQIQKNINLRISSCIQAHNDQINSFSFLNGDVNYLITSSLDYYFKIWNKSDLNLVGSHNINHPLPEKWDYKINDQQNQARRIIYALRILDIINIKYLYKFGKLNLVNILEKIISDNNQIDKIQLENDDQKNKQIQRQLSNKQQSNKNKVIIMKDKYSPRDIKYEESKKICQQEYLGMSLKRMEVNKRVAIAQHVWKTKIEQNYKTDKDIVKKQLDFYCKSDERESILNFLNQQYRGNLLNKNPNFNDEYSKQTKSLQQKFTQIDNGQRFIPLSNSKINFQQVCFKKQFDSKSTNKNQNQPSSNNNNNNSKVQIVNIKSEQDEFQNVYIFIFQFHIKKNKGQIIQLIKQVNIFHILKQFQVNKRYIQICL